MRTDKQVAYSLETVNGYLHHYLNRLVRKSRCFSRQVRHLSETFASLFIVTTHRQILKRICPKYSSCLVNFVLLRVDTPYFWVKYTYNI